MSGDEFLLKWNSHQSSIVEVFDEMLERQAFVDVTLSCEDRNFVAHKMILSACSSYFKELFLKNPCSHPVIFLKDVNSRDLDALLRFLYKGEVNIRQEDLGSLLNLAKSLKVKGLTEVSAPKGQHPEINEGDSTQYVETDLKCNNASTPIRNGSKRKSRDTENLSRKKTPVENEVGNQFNEPQRDRIESQLVREEDESEESWLKRSYRSNRHEGINSFYPHGEEPLHSPVEGNSEDSRSQTSSWLRMSHLVESPHSIPLYLSLMGESRGNIPYSRSKHGNDSNGPDEEIKCEICHKQFSSKTHLRRHSLIHSGVKPFACNVCTKKFYRPDHLKVHMKTHSRVKEYECSYCNSRFVSKQSLENHSGNSCPARPDGEPSIHASNSNSSASELQVSIDDNICTSEEPTPVGDPVPSIIKQESIKEEINQQERASSPGAISAETADVGIEDSNHAS